MRKYIIGSREFEERKLREFAASGDEAVLCRSMDTEIKAVGDESRALTFTISTESVDRYGDTVKADGWKLGAFRKNPVVLWMHDNTKLPLGKATSIDITGGKLRATVEFTPSGELSFNDAVFEMLKTGFLSATSVGFMPLKYNFVEDPQRGFGIDFIEQELLEFSIVTVPANAEALIEGRSTKTWEQAQDEAVDKWCAAEIGASVEFARRRLALLAA